MSDKVKGGKHEYLTHHELIKLILDDVLRSSEHPTPYIGFIDIDK